MAQIARPAYWLHYAFCVKKLSFVDGTTWYREWIRSSWERLIPQAGNMIEDAYHRAAAVL